ncbi:hypothetical protein TRAPUB_8684 [Trametes pubescens]|uniref:Secreted protein n=1 Tax=Trametes pubescens TaxID=154538 RepID=A0A1M2W4N7_TRAPU|nr:hypothetical protein TRAPUB_8684 [Trametes pubescens]
MFHSVESFLAVLAIFPTLECLVCDLLLGATSDKEVTANAPIEPVTPDHSHRMRPSRLKALVIDKGYWRNNTVLAG